MPVIRIGIHLFHLPIRLFKNTPVLLTQLLEISSQGIETEAEIMMMEIPLASVGLYMCIGVAAPFLIYIGNYLLHKHCGGCMLNDREMKYRIQCAKDARIPITNYGTAIAHMNGILERSLKVFQ